MSGFQHYKLPGVGGGAGPEPEGHCGSPSLTLSIYIRTGQGKGDLPVFEDQDKRDG